MAVRLGFFWPGMTKGVHDYTKGYDMCMQVTQQTGKVVGWLQPVPLAWGHWEGVGLDFITNVPISARENHCIATIVEYASKCTHWMPCTKTIDAAEVA